MKAGEEANEGVGQGVKYIEAWKREEDVQEGDEL